MQKISCKFTVCFENPFWVGVYERLEGGKLSVCKIIFGSEPKDYDIYAFLLENHHKLKFSSGIKSDQLIERKLHPKRMQREAGKLLSTTGVSTKAQLALKEQQQEGKVARKNKSRLEKEAEKERQFEIRQQKSKKKHKGR